MKFRDFVSGLNIFIAVLFLLSVSVHPAMAADIVNKELNNCAACSSDLSSIPGFEGKKVPVTVIREITPANGLLNAATVPGIPFRKVGTVSLNIADPRAENTVMEDKRMTAATGASEDLPAPITANLSSRGFVFTRESEIHRYETMLTSDDFAALNSSQKDTLASSGFASVSTATIRSYRDVTYYQFTNQTTGKAAYVMAIQQLDAGGNTIAPTKYSVSPEFSLEDGTAGFGAASAIQRNGTCFWNWVSVSLLTVALAFEILTLVYGAHPIWGFLLLETYWVDSRAFGDLATFSIQRLLEHETLVSLDISIPALYGIGIATGLVTLILLAYELYKLGVCMKWWDEISWESVAWTYQLRAGYTDNGKTLPVALHDRIVVALPVNTSVDKKAAWVPDLSGAAGLVIRDNRAETIGNSTIQAWLFEAHNEGPQNLTFRYVTIAPDPSAIPTTTFTLSIPVQRGSWKIMFVDNSSSRYGTGLYPSLAFDKTGSPHISSYDAGDGRIRYSSWNGTCWASETVADSAGTYSTSLAFDNAGTPAISFGDGYHFGNLMVATKKGTKWETVTVAKGSSGNAGQDSSLVFDKNGVPHITYNDGQNFATLKIATRNGTEWGSVSIDNGGWIGDTGYGSSLRLDAHDIPHVVYTSGKHFASLMYAVNTDNGWHTTTLDNGGGVLGSTGFTPSLAFDSRGFPHVSYYNASGEALMYASRKVTGWEYETVDSTNDVGAYSSLAIDAGDHPHIIYYDASNHELRYATEPGDTWIKRTIDNDGKSGCTPRLLSTGMVIPVSPTLMIQTMR